MNYSKIFLASASLLLAACSNDFDWEKAQLGDKYEYTKVFEESFGKIDPSQSWSTATEKKLNVTIGYPGENYIVKVYTTHPVEDAANSYLLATCSNVKGGTSVAFYIDMPADLSDVYVTIDKGDNMAIIKRVSASEEEIDVDFGVAATTRGTILEGASGDTYSIGASGRTVYFPKEAYNSFLSKLPENQQNRGKNDVPTNFTFVSDGGEYDIYPMYTVTGANVKLGVFYYLPGSTEKQECYFYETTNTDGGRIKCWYNGGYKNEIIYYYTPQVGTLDELISSGDVTFKINQQRDNRYAKYVSSSKKIGNSTNYEEGDDFTLESAGNSKFYIYDKTYNKYVVYNNTSKASGNVVLSDSKESNATWSFVSDGTGAYCIIPGSYDNPTIDGNCVSWNYYGGINNNLGLYNGNDNGSLWRIAIKVENEDDVPAGATMNSYLVSTTTTQQYFDYGKSNSNPKWATDNVINNASSNGFLYTECPGVALHLPYGTTFGFFVEQVVGSTSYKKYSNTALNNDAGNGWFSTLNNGYTLDGQEVRFVGAEDWDQKIVDLNDVVFAFVGRQPEIQQETTTNSKKMAYMLAFEDLGGNTEAAGLGIIPSDIDFNDVVLRIENTRNYTVTTTTTENGTSTDVTTVTVYDAEAKNKVTVLAAGGVYDTYIYYGNTPLFQGVTTERDDNGASEVHSLFGMSSDYMINTSGTSTKCRSSVAYPAACTFYSSEGLNASATESINDIARQFSIKVLKWKDNNIWSGVKEYTTITLPLTEGVVPQAVLIADPNWYWPTERTSILTAYPSFSDWVSASSMTSWYGAVWTPGATYVNGTVTDGFAIISAGGSTASDGGESLSGN